VLLALLGFPWFVHGAVVLLSALGARPLATRAPALVLLLLGSAFAGALALWQVRGQNSNEGDERDADLEAAELPRSAKVPNLVLITAAGIAIVDIAVL
jgi:hypothetical protein